MPDAPAPADRFQRLTGAVVLSLVLLALGALAGRLGYIHIALGDKLTDLARKQQRGFGIHAARRGSIFDVRGRQVAGTRLMREVFVDPAKVADIDAVAGKLGARLNLSPRVIADRIRRAAGSRYVLIASHVEEEDARAIREIDAQGVGLAQHPVRTYPLGSSMAHVLGIVGKDGGGLEAIELAYDQHLRGRDRVLRTVRDAGRRALWWNDSRNSDPIDGGHLVLTLDCEIQRIVEEQLDRTMAEFEGQSAMAIVMDPFNGDVLAMACRPTFDPNDYQSFPASLRRNRALTDPVEPGSIFKPFVAGGALLAGVVSPDELIDCHQGVHYFGRRRIRDTHPQGLLDLRGVIVQSSNIGMGIIGERMGNEALHQALLGFGFGRRLGIELPGESGGLVPPVERWTSYSTTSVPIGQEIAVTPLQLATAFCAIVNNGLLLRPRVVRALLTPGGEAVESFSQRQVIRRALPLEIARYLSFEVLPGVVEEGGGGNLRMVDYTMAGKTGTAQVPYADRRGYEPGMYLSSFVGAAPVDRPRLVALVMVRKPNRAKGYYGRVVSGPAVSEILAASLRYLDVPPDRPARLATR